MISRQPPITFFITMLDFMRRNAASWGIKTMLGLIAISFALFFGYSASRNRSVGPQNAAVIEEDAVSLVQFNRIFEASLANIRKNMSGEVPDDLVRFLRSNTLEQIIQRSVYRQFAERLGFQVAASEVARMIQKQEQFYRDGIFDRAFYQEQFRPYYRRQYGQDYEAAIREDLILDAFTGFLEVASLIPLEEAEWRREHPGSPGRETESDLTPTPHNDALERAKLWIDDFRSTLDIKKNPDL